VKRILDVLEKRCSAGYGFARGRSLIARGHGLSGHGLNHASKELITAIGSGKSFPECGADDSQANSLVKAAIAVTAFEGLDDWALRVDDVMRAHQNNAIAVKYGVGAAHLVRQILNG
jgi:hypothetical protein